MHRDLLAVTPLLPARSRQAGELLWFWGVQAGTGSNKHLLTLEQHELLRLLESFRGDSSYNLETPLS